MHIELFNLGNGKYVIFIKNLDCSSYLCKNCYASKVDVVEPKWCTYCWP